MITRSVDGITVPKLPVFTEQTYNTAKATPITSSNNILADKQEYIINGSYNGSLNTNYLKNGEQAIVYVAGTWIPDDWSSQGLVHVIVLKEGRITAKNFTMNTGMDLTIQSGASVTGQGTWGSSTGITIVNFGTFNIKTTNYEALNLNSDCTLFNGENAQIEADKFSCNTNVKINNEGYIKVNNEFSINSGATVYNAKGKRIDAQKFNASTGGSLFNFGKVDIEGNISMNTSSILYNGEGGLLEGEDYVAAGSTNVNYGTMELENYDNGNAGGAKLYNYCSLFVDDKVAIGGYIYMDHGVIAEEKEDDDSFDETDEIKFYNNAEVILTNGSMIKGKTIKTGTDLIVKGMPNTNTSLLKSKTLEINAGAPLTFTGNLTISAENIRVNSGNYNLEDGAICTEKPDVIIGDCNGKTELPDPAPEPSDPNFPIIVEDNHHNYTYLFEDQWPLYGDYDMNDIVLEIRKRKMSMNEKNKITELELSIELTAVGAQKAIAAAIMFDEIPASAVTQPVTYANNYRPVSFDLTDKNIEKGQDYAVVPLFDNAHALMERPAGSFVNTVSGSDNNQKDSITINFTLKFDPSSAPSSDALNINKLNIFIITDRGSKRKEIHVAGYQPTKLANTELFGGNNDASSVNGKKYYISKDNLAWGIIVPTQFKWPLEYTKIQNAYKQFAGWVTSGGVNNTKWWNDFDNTKVFQTNKN